MITTTTGLRRQSWRAGWPRPIAALVIALVAASGLVAPAFGQTPVAGQGTSLVCVGMGGEGLALIEWSPAEIADYVNRVGRDPDQPHPETGECRDPAGLTVGAGWTRDLSWRCTLGADGLWRGPLWVASIYAQGTDVAPSPETGDCPQPTQVPRIRLNEAGRAAATAVHLAELEVAGDYDRLYAWMHPDSRALVSPEAMAGWYRDVFAARPPISIAVEEVRLAEWTWGVTGTRYPTAAEVTLRIGYATGEEGAVTDTETVRLVREGGVWRWFFGRDRAFVDEQVARYG